MYTSRSAGVHVATFFFHCSWQVLQPAVPLIHVLSCPCNSCCLPVVQQLHPRVCTAQALLASSGLLQPLHIPHGPWDSVSTDFVTGPPKIKAGHDAILVFVDRLTKYVHIVPTTTKCTAKTWADLFIQHVFCNHGLPLEVISDRGPQFAGKYNQALSDRLRISWNMSTAFHPQTDGQTERMNSNRTVEDMHSRSRCRTRPSTLNMAVTSDHL